MVEIPLRRKGSWGGRSSLFEVIILYKFCLRYDNPSLGRWAQQDPVGGSLGDLNSANRSVYAGDDPCLTSITYYGNIIAHDCGLPISF